MSHKVIGLDVGGANLKVASTDGIAITRPFELWKHPKQLADELRRLASEIGRFEWIALTMTGELCDCFENKRTGVRHILAAARDAFYRP